jgi:hypothetical protein
MRFTANQGRFIPKKNPIMLTTSSNQTDIAKTYKATATAT